MTDRHWWPRRKRPAWQVSPHAAPGPGEPGNPPEGHRQTTQLCGCVHEYGPGGEITRRWSCMRAHFPLRPL